MKKILIAIVCAAFPILLQAARVGVCPPDSLVHLLDSFADVMGQKLNGTMLVAHYDTILEERAFGYRELYHNGTGYDSSVTTHLDQYRNAPENAMTPQTLFELASVSKQFTAAAVLKLCCEGKMSLTDYLGKYLPDFPYTGITIRHLLSHTSGLPEYFDFPYAYYDSVRFVNNARLVKVLQKYHPAKKFSTGSQFAYCNTNYALLAYIVAQVSGMPFEQYVHEYIFKPAGMQNTFFVTELANMTDDDFTVPCVGPKVLHVPVQIRQDLTTVPVARGHWNSGVRTNYDRLNGVLGDKGIYSNVEDLMRWTNAYFVEYKIIPKEWVDQASERENKLSTGKLAKQIYGYGLRIEMSPEYGKLIYHGGLWNGFHNVWLFRPDDGYQIIFLSNYYNHAHAGKSNLIFSIIDQFK